MERAFHTFGKYFIGVNVLAVSYSIYSRVTEEKLKVDAIGPKALAPPSEHIRAQLFNSQARIYDEQAVHREDDMRMKQAREDLMRKVSGHTIEIHSGTGRNIPALDASGKIKSLTCLDRSDGMLNVTKEKLEWKRLSPQFPITLVRADSTHLPYADDSFDSAVAVLAVSTSKDPEATLRELHRVTRAGGRVAVCDLCANRWWPLRTMQTILGLDNYVNAWQMGIFGKRDVRGMAKDAGFTEKYVSFMNSGNSVVLLLEPKKKKNGVSSSSNSSNPIDTKSNAVVRNLLKSSEQSVLTSIRNENEHSNNKEGSSNSTDVSKLLQQDENEKLLDCDTPAVIKVLSSRLKQKVDLLKHANLPMPQRDGYVFHVHIPMSNFKSNTGNTESTN